MELKATIYLHAKRDMATIAQIVSRWSYVDLALPAGVTPGAVGLWLQGRRGLSLAAVRSIEDFTEMKILPPLEELPLCDDDEIRARRSA